MKRYLVRRPRALRPTTVILRGNQWVTTFYVVRPSSGNVAKLGVLGNSGVADEFAVMLEKLGWRTVDERVVVDY